MSEPRVDDERLEKIIAYANSDERQGYPVPMSVFKGLLADLRDCRARLADAERQRDAMLQQAQCWAAEAKAQRATVNEVGSALGGIPDWGPIAATVGERLAERDALRAELDAERAARGTGVLVPSDKLKEMQAELARAREAAGRMIRFIRLASYNAALVEATKIADSTQSASDWLRERERRAFRLGVVWKFNSPYNDTPREAEIDAALAEGEK